MAAVRGADGRFIKGSGAPGWTPGGSSSGGSVKVTTDMRALARADKRLAKYAGRDLATRAKRAYLEGAKLGTPYIRKAAPVGKTGNLQRSTLAKSVRARGAPEMAAASVGPRGGSRKGGHKYVVQRGHRIVTHTGRDTGGRVPGNPYVERAESQWVDKAQSFIRQRVLDIGFGSSGVSFRSAAGSGISTF